MADCEKCVLLDQVGRRPNWEFMRIIRLERNRIAELEDQIRHLQAHLKAVEAEVTRLERLSAG